MPYAAYCRMVKMRAGFTLIEISIVLVVIGLVIGGILLGQELISAAEIRATISQIQKYQTSMYTFRTKYRAMPGDIMASQAISYGFFTRSGGDGDGDGNGMIEGLGGNEGPDLLLGGETVYFWTDLTSAQMINESFTDNTGIVIDTAVVGTNFSRWLPRAKTGNGHFLAYTTPLQAPYLGQLGFAFQLARFHASLATSMNIMDGALSPTQSLTIESKMDDGKPFSGKVLAMYPGMTGTITGPGLFLGATSPFLGATEQYCISTAPHNYNANFPGSTSCTLAFLIQ